MMYSIEFHLDYNTECARCHTPLMVGVKFVHDGRLITVGRECAKHYGITWTPAVGPLADDPEMFERALNIHAARAADWRNGYRWPGGWAACQPVKEALGARAWKRAARMAVRR